MQAYVVRRLLASIPVLILVSIIGFVILRIAPGDPVVAALGDATDAIDPRVHAELRRQLGLDRPLGVQYLDWFAAALRFDFGVSLLTRKPIVDEILNRLPITMEISILSLSLTLLIALPVGMVSAVFHNRPVDHALRVFTMVGLALPGFWLGLLIITALVRLFNWLPPLRVVGFVDDPALNLAQFIWPSIAIAYHSSAILARIIRASLLEVLELDYIRTARSKGLRERIVVARHAFKNSLPPVLATLGFIVASVLTGTIVIETVFNIPGLGRYLIDSITDRDYPVLQAMIVLTALVVILVNLTVDIVQGVLDPRVGHG